MARRLGWRKSPAKPLGAKPDFSASAVLTGPVVATADNTSLMRDLIEQGDHESCVGNAVACLLRGDLMRQFGAAFAVLPSRNWIWYLARAQDGAQKADAGTYIRNAFSAVAKLGYPAEAYWPYDDAEVEGHAGQLEPRWAVMPSSEAFSRARDQVAHDAVTYYRIQETGDARIDMVKRAHGMGLCAVFGTLVTDEFMGYQGDRVLHVTGQAAVGGHALVSCGHDDAGVYGPNWWGKEWGDGGYFHLGWDYVAWSQSDDFWVALHAPKISG